MRTSVFVWMILLAVPMFSNAHAADRRAPGAASAAPSQAGLTSNQRATIARALVHKWGGEVREQGGDVYEWGVKLGRFVGTADAENVLQATTMPTYTTMMGVLQGQPVQSKSVQGALMQEANFGTKSLGSAISDTTFTPLPNGRCRVADSRVISSPLPGGIARAIDTEDTTTYAAYGGNGTYANGDGSTACGIPSYATAVAVAVTVLSRGTNGVFKIYENGKPYQTGSTIYYTSSVSAANDMIVTSCQTCAEELSIYSSSAVDYVIDVVGYFMPPQATALQCVDTADAVVSVAAGTGANAFAPACSAGFTQTATNCESSTWQMPFVFFSGGTCSAQNNSSSSATLRASRTCCRVPGR